MLIEGEDEGRAMLQFKTKGINNFTKAKLYDNLSKDLHNKPDKLNCVAWGKSIPLNYQLGLAVEAGGAQAASSVLYLSRWHSQSLYHFE
jgi:hypothetical protein